jgi:PAS domain S-box-containing protein
VLVVDDNEEDRILALRALQREHPLLETVQPTDASSLASALAGGEFDLVITDYGLRWSDGLAVARAVKDRSPLCPVVMYTGTGNEQVAVAAMKLGIEDYVMKSAVPTALAVAVRGALAHAAERGLRHAREALLQGMLESAVDAVIVMDHEGRVVDHNSAAESMFGYARDEAVGRTVAELIVPPDLRARHTAGLARVVGGEPPRLLGRHREFPAVRRSGEQFPAEVSIASVRGAQPPLFVAYVRDLTERRRLEAQFLQAQKMESVGRLAGGIAHDFNNILTAILGYADLLLEELADTPHRPDITEIKRSAERAALLTRQLLAFGRRQILMPQVVDVNALIVDLERMLTRLIGEDIDLSTALSPELRLVHVDPGQMTQAIMNLVVNARDAMPNGGKLTIETRNVHLDESYAAKRPDVAPGEYVRVTVSDTGVGMDADVQAHLFEPFFTTKERGRGTGLGLSTAYGIVRQSGGHIAVYSEPGRGSTFSIYLPPTTEAPTPRPVAAGPAAANGTETILLVEDEEPVRALARRVLAGYGYQVLVAATAEEGRRLWREHGAHIHLLVTDVVLPGASGPELVRALRDDRPDLWVLYTSGYSEAAIVRRGVLDPQTPYLQKPFAATALAVKVREVLDAREPRDP